MNSRSLLTLALLSATPSLLFAQPQPPMDPPPALEPSRLAIHAAPLAPAVPMSPAIPMVQAIAPAPEAPQTPPAPPAAPKTYTATVAPTPPAAPKTYTATVAPTPPAAPAPPRAPGQMLNVQIEVTLSDTKSTPKTVVLTVADGELGQNRTNSAMNVATAGTSYSTFTFNADARPSIVGNKIRLYLSAEAIIPASPEAKAGAAANITLRQQQTLVLTDGDSVEIARASDPVSDRSFILSVKVKIQR